MLIPSDIQLTIKDCTACLYSIVIESNGTATVDLRDPNENVTSFNLPAKELFNVLASAVWGGEGEPEKPDTGYVSNEQFYAEIGKLTQYVDNQDVKTINTVSKSSKTYADDKDIITLASAKTYTNEKDVATLKSAKDYAVTQDESVLKTANTYTDTEVTKILTDAEAYADKQDEIILKTAKDYTDEITGDTGGSIKDYVDDTADTTLTSAKSYTDTEVATTLTTSKAYTDTEVATTLTTAKGYTDTETASTLTTAKTYTDDTADATLASAKDYTDTETATTLTSAEKYVDDNVPTLKAGFNITLEEKNNEITINAIADGGSVIPSTGLQSSLFIGADNSLLDTLPTDTSLSMPIELDGTTVKVIDYTFTAVEALKVSPTSSYEVFLNLSSLKANTTYTIATSWLSGAVLISRGVETFPASAITQNIFVVPMKSNLITMPIDVKVDETLTLKIEIKKNNASTDTINLLSNNTLPSGISRNTSTISTSSVYEAISDTETVSQASINANVDVRIGKSLTDAKDYADKQDGVFFTSHIATSPEASVGTSNDKIITPKTLRESLLGKKMILGMPDYAKTSKELLGNGLMTYSRTVTADGWISFSFILQTEAVNITQVSINGAMVADTKQNGSSTTNFYPVLAGDTIKYNKDIAAISSTCFFTPMR